MKQIISSKINSILGLLLLSFPILIILGSFALNCFSIIFSLYAIFNYKRFLNIDFINPKAKIFFFSFIILIFPFESFEFQDSFSQSSIFISSDPLTTPSVIFPVSTSICKASVFSGLGL